MEDLSQQLLRMNYELRELLMLLSADTFNIKENVQMVAEKKALILPHLSEENQQLLTNAIKDKVQRDADKAHRNSGRWGLICAATGVGKSKIGINMANKVHNYNNQANILLVVPTQKLRDTGWAEEFEQWDQSYIYHNNITKVCYKSLSKIKGKTFDLVILDECHNLTDKNIAFFKSNEVKALVGLTATKPKKLDKQVIFELVKLNLVYEITLDDAVALGIVSPYEVTVVKLKLDSTNKYIKAGSKEKPFYQTEQAAYNYFRKVENNQFKKLSQFFFLKRMQFIYNLKSKTQVAQSLLTTIPDHKRVVIFSGSCQQADEVSVCRFHSETDDECYEAFKRLEINRLSCVNSLNEGHNLPLLDIGLVVQINSNDLHITQRIGRFIRYRPNHTAKIIILVAENTVDEKWVNTALSELDQSRIRYINYTDILSGTVVFNF